jgi:hypothetical protein
VTESASWLRVGVVAVPCRVFCGVVAPTVTPSIASVAMSTVAYSHRRPPMGSRERVGTADTLVTGTLSDELMHLSSIVPSSTASTNEPEISVLRRAPSVGSAMRCSQASTETWWGGMPTLPTTVTGQHRVARRSQRDLQSKSRSTQAQQVRTSTTDDTRPPQTFTRVHPPRGSGFARVILQVVLNMRISLSECAREETPHSDTTSWSDCVEGFHKPCMATNVAMY